MGLFFHPWRGFIMVSWGAMNYKTHRFSSRLPEKKRTQKTPPTRCENIQMPTGACEVVQGADPGCWNERLKPETVIRQTVSQSRTIPSNFPFEAANNGASAPSPRTAPRRLEDEAVTINGRPQTSTAKEREDGGAACEAVTVARRRDISGIGAALILDRRSNDTCRHVLGVSISWRYSRRREDAPLKAPLRAFYGWAPHRLPAGLSRRLVTSVVLAAVAPPPAAGHRQVAAACLCIWLTSAVMMNKKVEALIKGEMLHV